MARASSLESAFCSFRWSSGTRNTYIFTLSNHKIECRNDKPVALDVSLGNVSVQVNMQFVGEAENGDSSVGFSYLPRGYYQLKDETALPQAHRVRLCVHYTGGQGEPHLCHGES